MVITRSKQDANYVQSYLSAMPHLLLH